MKCGAKCFLVEMNINDRTETVPVTARTPIDARKVIRSKFGVNMEIISVRQKN